MYAGFICTYKATNCFFFTLFAFYLKPILSYEKKIAEFWVCYPRNLGGV